MRYLVVVCLLAMGCSPQAAQQPNVKEVSKELSKEETTFQQGIISLADEIDAEVKSMGDGLDETRLKNAEFKFRTVFEALPKSQNNPRLHEAWKEMNSILNQFDVAASLVRSTAAYKQAGAAERADQSAKEAVATMEKITSSTAEIRRLLTANQSP